ncbi:MAG TPA: GAF domain-containing protein [Gaiellaceae bacterium]|nr:GAF domain-containing protein [Gaiellaceae bacterium]
METRLELLRGICDRLVAELDGGGCLLSRRIGDVLILVAEDAKLRSTRIGRGYLVSDFPTTRRVLEERVAVTLAVDDEDADPAEVAILHELGFWSLLMLPFEVAGEVWGLLEVYGERGRHFDEADAARACTLAHV